MASVFDVAAYILEQMKLPVTTMKMQKLLYYSQAWSLVWDNEPLFPERIEAWANGPVAPDYWRAHQGEFVISAEPQGSPANLNSAQKDTIEAVIAAYGDRTPQWLSDQTHREAPWADARQGMSEGQRGNREITTVSMSNYYGSL